MKVSMNMNNEAMKQYVAALGGPTNLHEARQRPTQGGVGTIEVGDAFQVNNAKAPNGKATCVVRKIRIRYGLGEPVVVIAYDYKVGTTKGSEEMELSRFIKAIGAE
jgi:hypothetical protein